MVILSYINLLRIAYRYYSNNSFNIIPIVDKLRPAGPDGEPVYGPDWTGPCLRQIRPAGPTCDPACGPDWTGPCLTQI